MPFGPVIYIERSDFNLDPPPKYWRLSVGKTVGLKYGPNITCNGYQSDDAGTVTEIQCTVDFQKMAKPKAHIQWISEQNKLEIDVNIFSPQKDQIENKTTIRGAQVESEPLIGIETVEQFQFERLGYFSFDPSSSHDRLVFNQTMELKSSFN
jgi:glutaminyl-tRNA synthetase